MTASYTTNGRFTKQGNNDNPNTWGQVLNGQVIDLVDHSIFGVADVDITGSSNVTLTTVNGSTDQARYATLELTGTLGGDIDLIIPAVDKQYFIRGAWTGDHTVTVKISGSSTSVSLETGDKKIIYSNGTDVFDMVVTDLSSALQKTENLNDLPNKATARVNLGLTSLATSTLTSVLQAAYPVGSVYINSSVATNPATLLGFGTWTAIGQGRVLIGHGSGTDTRNETIAFTAQGTGGAYKDLLTIDTMPAHNHVVFSNVNDTAAGANGRDTYEVRSVSGPTNGLTSTVGGSQPHNNIQPYLVVYMWTRTA